MARESPAQAAGGAVSRRSRQDPAERRKQLIGIGLELLTRRPLHQITVDEVAAQAGISRSLLFHYFATKREYYAEVVRAASRRILRATRSREDDSGNTGTVDALIAGYLDFIERRHEPYVALFRSAGTDDWVREILADTRTELAAQLLAALGINAPEELVRTATGSWLSFAEEMALAWAQHGIGTRDEVHTLLTETLRKTARAATKRDCS